MTSENAAPAEMPGEREIAAAIYQARNGKGCVHWSRLPHSHQEPYLSDARAVLALFAPILAEKERERDEWHAAHGRAATRAYDQGERADAAEARALAAEAALAAERERCLAIVEAQVPEWVKQRSGPYWDGYREAMEDAADDIRKGAAAIRAQGPG